MTAIQTTSTQDPDWDLVMQSGCIVKLHVRRWRAVRRRSLTDLGITVADDEKTAWNDFLDSGDIGAMKLLPISLINEMRSAENSARQALRKWGIGTPWGTFLPIARLSEWESEDRRREDKYLQFRDRIRDDYESIKLRAWSAYYDAAGSVYCRANDLPATTSVPSSYRNDYANDHMSTFMSCEALCATISWEREYIALRSPSMIAADIAERSRILTEAKLTEKQRALVLSLDEKLARDADKAKRDTIQSFLDSVQTELRTRIAEVCQDVENCLRKNARISVSNIRQIRNLIDTVTGLNVLDDTVIAEKMRDLTAVVGRASDNPDLDQSALIRTIRETALVVRGYVADVDESIRNPRIDILDVTPDSQDLAPTGRRL